MSKKRTYPLLGLMVTFAYFCSSIRNAVNDYNNISSNAKSCDYRVFHVPADGSVSTSDCAEAEGILSVGDRMAYEDALRRNTRVVKLPTDPDGNLIILDKKVDPVTGEVCEVSIEASRERYKGVLPPGSFVNLPDLNGDGRVGPEYYRQLSELQLLQNIYQNIEESKMKREARL